MSSSLRVVPYGLVWLILVLGCVSMVSCRDISKICQRYVDKYQQCIRHSHLRAKEAHARLGSLEQKRSAILLQKLEQQLQSPQWKTRQMQACLKNPPSRKRFSCVEKTSCDALSRCNPQISTLAPEPK